MKTSDLGAGVWYPILGSSVFKLYLPKQGARLVIEPGANRLSLDWEVTRASVVSFMRKDATKEEPLSLRILDEAGEVVFELRDGLRPHGVPLLPGKYTYEWSDAEGKGVGELDLTRPSNYIRPLR